MLGLFSILRLALMPKYKLVKGFYTALVHLVLAEYVRKTNSQKKNDAMTLRQEELYVCLVHLYLLP